jgi:hypothetical protein
LFRVSARENVISGSPVIAVSTVTALWAGWLKFGFLAGVRNFVLLLNTQTDSGTHPAYYSIHAGAVTVAIVRLEHEADQ